MYHIVIKRLWCALNNIDSACLRVSLHTVLGVALHSFIVPLPEWHADGMARAPSSFTMSIIADKLNATKTSGRLVFTSVVYLQGDYRTPCNTVCLLLLSLAARLQQPPAA